MHASPATGLSSIMAAMVTFHGRPLPADQPALAGPRGRVLFREALLSGHAESFFPLVSHLHTQAEPAWCGLGSLVTALNALAIDPGRTLKGPWRYFGEALLDCCKSLDATTAEGLTLTEVACLARCNGARVDVVHASGADALERFRAELVQSVRASEGRFIVANYDRKPLGQTGSGHFSPLAAWHEPSDHVLILDVARFKYPPHWVPVARLLEAMRAPDPDSGRARGYLVLSPAVAPVDELDRVEIDKLVDKLDALGAPSCPRCPG